MVVTEGRASPGLPAADFEEIVGPLRRELLVHCYRMLGSMPDAEDAVQDALLRAWKGASRFEGRSSHRTWLYRITTNVCLSRLARRSARLLPVDLGPAGDPAPGAAWPRLEGAFVGPFPDVLFATPDADPGAAYETREAVELAFVVALQQLTPRQRAVLLLFDVLGFSAKETAATMKVTVASVTSALQRARRTMKHHLPDASQQQTLRALGDDQLRTLASRYADAWERGDVADILALVTDDVTFSMPPHPIWFSGRQAVAEFLPAGPLRLTWRLVQTHANGQLAFGFYTRSPDGGPYVAHSLDVITVCDDRVAAITAFLEQGADDFTRFGLPATLTETRA